MTSVLRYRIVNLRHRGLLQVTGADTFPYIQSILTNDLRNPSRLVYGTFPNAAGRVLLDLMVYKVHGDPSDRQLMLNAVAFERYGIDGKPGDSLLIECDSDLLEPARKTLFAYKIRRQVTISHAAEYDLFAIYPDVDDIRTLNRSDLPQLDEIFSPDLMIGQDPRIGCFSYRIISRLGRESLLSLLSHHIPYPLVDSSLSDYHRFRYKIGLAEGKDDYRPCFRNPLEFNLDYMNGLSVSKGQFIAKQLIFRHSARFNRTYRVMPIELLLPDKVENLNLAFGTRICGDNDQKLIGTLINRKGCYGLAALNLSGCLRNGFKLKHLESGVEINTWFPTWWPQPLKPKDYYLAQRQMKLINKTEIQEKPLIS